MSPVIQIQSVTKSYGGVRALVDVSFSIAAGEIHAVCGENGAGKSTLIKSLSGVVIPDSGEILINGHPLAFGSVQASEAAGVSVIHQESTAFPDLNVVDNLFVGREPRWFGGQLLDRKRMYREAQRQLGRLGQTLDLSRPVGELALAQRQLVSMARALSQECCVLVLDEPTASLSVHETETLLGIVRQLREEGVAILYVSHRLDEVMELADRITVLRDGHYAGTSQVSDITKQQLIHSMVGRAAPELAHRHEHRGDIGDVCLEVKRLRQGNAFADVSLTVRAGEIVGIAGLVGAGRSEVARAVFGIDDYDAGEVLVNGKRVPKNNVGAAISHGLALVPEDRQHEGLVLPMTVRENLTLAVLRTLASGGIVQGRRETELAESLAQQLQVKAAHHRVPAMTLSGGNQQKLVIGKWLATKPSVLMLDEPTRGVDVGAKAQVHQLIRRLAEDGMATLVISSELPELLSICDRIMVMCEGTITGNLEGRTATQEEVLELALPKTQLST